MFHSLFSIRSHRSFDPTFCFTFADIGAPIVLFFATAHRELELDESPLTIQAKRDQSQAFSTDFPYKRGDVPLPEKEFAGPSVFVRDFLSGVAVAGDKGVGEPEFTIVNGDKGSAKAGMAGFDAADLTSSQDNASLVVVLEAVVIARSSVVGDGVTHIAV